MAKKRRRGEVNSLEDLIYYAQEAGFDSIVERAERLKVFFDDLKSLKVESKMTFKDFLNLKSNDKFVLACFEDDDYSFLVEVKKEEVLVKKTRICFTTSYGDHKIKLESDDKEMLNLEDLSDNMYTYTFYNIRTRKSKIKKLLSENE